MAVRKGTPESQETTITNPLDDVPDTPAAAPAQAGGGTEKITINAIDSDVMGRARGFLAWINMNGEVDGIYDLSTLFSRALEKFIPTTEKKFNDSTQWKPPARGLTRGRKP